MCRFLVATLALSLAGAVTSAQDQAPPLSPSPEGEVVRETLKAYLAAFNNNEAQALVQLWTAQGEYTDRDTGEKTSGREALLIDFQRLFKEHGGARLSAHVTGWRQIRGDVVAVQGQTRVVMPNVEPVDSNFSAILVKEGDKWLIDSVEESAVPATTGAHHSLKELDWLVGHWVDQLKSGRVNTTVRWGSSNSFLVRSFVSQHNEGEIRQGTQVIGWDPRMQQIRSWSFFSDGSFGEAYWSKNGDDWLIKSAQTLPDGGTATGTQVIHRVDENTLRVENIGREINGVPVPRDEPLTVVRTTDSADSPPPATPPPPPPAAK